MTLPPVDSQITFLYTRDQARSAEFYEDVLGLELVVDQGSCRIYRVLGSSAFIGICQREDANEQSAEIIFTLVTPDVDGWYRRIVARGWPCEHPPRRNETFDIYHFFLRDPSGYLIEIQRFARDDWDTT